MFSLLSFYLGVFSGVILLLFFQTRYDRGSGASAKGAREVLLVRRRVGEGWSEWEGVPAEWLKGSCSIRWVSYAYTGSDVQVGRFVVERTA